MLIKLPIICIYIYFRGEGGGCMPREEIHGLEAKHQSYGSQDIYLRRPFGSKEVSMLVLRCYYLTLV
jgi:hypothetical protein